MTEPRPLAVAISSTDAGVLLPVKAQPGARRNAVVGVHDGRLKVAVVAPPEDGRANSAIIELLAESFDMARRDIELTQGASSRLKQFLLRGAELQSVEDGLTSLFRE